MQRLVAPDRTDDPDVGVNAATFLAGRIAATRTTLIKFMVDANVGRSIDDGSFGVSLLCLAFNMEYYYLLW